MQQEFVNEFAKKITEIDKEVKDNWGPGISTFPENKQIKKVTNRLEKENDFTSLEITPSYPERSSKADLIVESLDMVIEAKLIRIRGGKTDGNYPKLHTHNFNKVFNPFKEGLVHDAHKLDESEFTQSKYIMGIYYGLKDDPIPYLTFENLITKFENDVEYWYDILMSKEAIKRFNGIRGPHEEGAVVLWKIEP